jgi:urease accessory protein
MLKAVAIQRASEREAVRFGRAPTAKAVLEHDERHLRRRTVSLTDGRKVFFDLPETVVLEHGDVVVLDDGSHVEIVAADEPLYAIVAADPFHLTELAWHIGNRHLPAAIETDRILIRRDHVIKAMLEGLHAKVTDVIAPFNPVRGAYAGDGHAREHDHGHHHHHD